MRATIGSGRLGQVWTDCYIFAKNRGIVKKVDFWHFLLVMRSKALSFGPLMSSENAPVVSQSKNPMDLTYTDVEKLYRYVTGTGKILPRRITGLTARQQRHVTKVIKQSRNMLLMK